MASISVNDIYWCDTTIPSGVDLVEYLKDFFGARPKSEHWRIVEVEATYIKGKTAYNLIVEPIAFETVHPVWQ